VSARAQLIGYQRQIGSEATRIVTAVRNEFNVAQSREASIEQLHDRNEKLANQHQYRPTISCVSLNGKLEANKALFESFLAKFKQTSRKKSWRDQFPVIERAATPTSPSAPNKRLIALMAGLTAGLGFGVAVAFLLEQLDSGFRTNRQIEQRLGVPVLASVPRADGELAPGDGGVLHKINPFGWLFRLVPPGGDSGPANGQVHA
jgi:succinoglycan biosynthesis transport protein ExoP